MAQTGGELGRSYGFNTATAGRGAISQAPSFPRLFPTPAPAPTQSPYGNYAATIPGPQQRQPDNIATVPGPQQYNPGYGGPGGTGGGIPSGGGSAPVAAPAPPPKLTADDFAAKYKGNDKGLAITDSTFADQQSQYANVLKKYIEDYTRQYGANGDKNQFDGTIGRDAKTAVDGIGRNKTNGLTSQAEDFFARGIGQSGLFATEQQKATDQYDRQNNNVLDSLRDQRATLNSNKAKMEMENGASGSNIQNARREAYNRLALKQMLQ